MSITAALIDQREPEWVKSLTFGGAMTAPTLLDSGDLLVTCDDGTLLAIERKTPDDLLNSIRDDRLWSQLAGIKALSRWAYLVVTGELRQGSDGKVWTDSRSTGWAWAAVQGALLQAQEMGVFVVFSAGDDDYEPAVMRLAARSHRAEMLVPPAREPRILSEAERILTAFPGIGPERVAPLLDYAGTAAWGLQYLSDLSTNGLVAGVGVGTKRAVRKALGLTDDQTLAIVRTDGQLATKE